LAKVVTRAKTFNDGWSRQGHTHTCTPGTPTHPDLIIAAVRVDPLVLVAVALGRLFTCLRKGAAAHRQVRMALGPSSVCLAGHNPSPSKLSPSSGAVEQWSSGAVHQWSSGAVDQWSSGATSEWQTHCACAMRSASSKHPQQPGQGLGW